MINFVQILECTVEHTPAGRRDGLDRSAMSERGLVGVSVSGDLYRYSYTTKTWSLWKTVLL